MKGHLMTILVVVQASFWGNSLATESATQSRALNQNISQKNATLDISINSWSLLVGIRRFKPVFT